MVSTKQQAINLMHDHQDLLTKGVVARLKLARSKDIKKATGARLTIIKDAIARSKTTIGFISNPKGFRKTVNEVSENPNLG